ncbi:hypothetical protein D3C73_700770 [compost metagenome]
MDERVLAYTAKGATLNWSNGDLVEIKQEKKGLHPVVPVAALFLYNKTQTGEISSLKHLRFMSTQ